MPPDHYMPNGEYMSHGHLMPNMIYSEPNSDSTLSSPFPSNLILRKKSLKDGRNDVHYMPPGHYMSNGEYMSYGHLMPNMMYSEQNTDSTLASPFPSNLILRNGNINKRMNQFEDMKKK